MSSARSPYLLAVDGVFEFATKIRRNLPADLFKPLLECLSRPVSIGADWVSRNLGERPKRLRSVVPSQRLKFFLVHFFRVP
jgi:hypothetical protein